MTYSLKKIVISLFLLIMLAFSLSAMAATTPPKLGVNIRSVASVNYANPSGGLLSANSNVLMLKVTAFYLVNGTNNTNLGFNGTTFTFSEPIYNDSNDTIVATFDINLTPIVHSEQINNISYMIYKANGTKKFTNPVVSNVGGANASIANVRLEAGDYVLFSTEVDNLTGFATGESLTLEYSINSATGTNYAYNANTGAFTAGSLTGTQLQFGGIAATLTETALYTTNSLTASLILNPITNIRHGLPTRPVNIKLGFDLPATFSASGDNLVITLTNDAISPTLNAFDIVSAVVGTVTGNRVALDKTPVSAVVAGNTITVTVNASAGHASDYNGKTIAITLTGSTVSVGDPAGSYNFDNKFVIDTETFNVPNSYQTIYTVDRDLKFTISPVRRTIAAATRDFEFNTGSYTLTNTGTVPLTLTTALSVTPIPTVPNEQTIYTDSHNSIEGTVLGVGQSVSVDVLLNTKNLAITGTPQTEHVIFSGSNLSDTASPIDLPIILQTVINLTSPTMTVNGLGDAAANRKIILFGDDNIIRVDIKNNSSVTQTFDLTTGFLGTITSTAGTNSFASKMDYHTTYISGLNLPATGSVPQVTIGAGKTVEYYIHYIPLTGYKAGNDDMLLTAVDVSDPTKKATATDYWNVPKQTALGVHKHADATSQSVSDLKHTVLDDVILYNNDSSFTNTSTYKVTLENAASYAGIAGFKVYLFVDTNHNGKYDPGVDHLTTTLTPAAATYSVDAYASTVPGTSMPIYSGIELVYDAADQNALLNKQVVVTFAFNTQAGITNNLTRFPGYFATVKDNIIFNGQGDILSIKHYQKTSSVTCVTSKPITDATSENALGLAPGNCALYTIEVSPITPTSIGDIDVAEDLDNYLNVETPIANFRIVDVNGGVTVDESGEFTVSHNPTDNKEHIVLKTGSTYQLHQNHKLNITFEVQMKKH